MLLATSVSFKHFRWASPWSLHVVKEYNCAQRHGGAFITLQIGAGSTAQHTLQWLEEKPEMT